MSTASVSVKKSRSSQTDLRDHREHASASAIVLQAVGCVVGQQVRVRRNSASDALYTVSEVADEHPAEVVRMGAGGRQRLGVTDEFDGVVDPTVVDPTASDADTEARGELIERLDDDGVQRDFIVLAPHGGAIEAGTDLQAEHVARRLVDRAVSCWRCKGWSLDGGAFVRWHITSTDIHPASFPLLASIASRGFTHGVAFHGFDDPSVDADIVGGGAPRAIKRLLRKAIADAVGAQGLRVRIAAPDDPIGGADARNIVNRVTTNRRNGVQIEQSVRARTTSAVEIPDALAAVYRAKLD